MTTQWTIEQRKHYLDWFKFAQEATITVFGIDAYQTVAPQGSGELERL